MTNIEAVALAKQHGLNVDSFHEGHLVSNKQQMISNIQWFSMMLMALKAGGTLGTDCGAYTVVNDNTIKKYGRSL